MVTKIFTVTVRLPDGSTVDFEILGETREQAEDDANYLVEKLIATRDQIRAEEAVLAN